MPSAPEGAIKRWIATNPLIPGVGDGYAERLWDASGDQLYDLIRARDVQALAKVLDVTKPTAIIQAFGLLLDEVTALQELDGRGVDGVTASAAVRLFGAGRRKAVPRKSIRNYVARALVQGRRSGNR